MAAPIDLSDVMSSLFRPRQSATGDARPALPPPTSDAPSPAQPAPRGQGTTGALTSVAVETDDDGADDVMLAEQLAGRSDPSADAREATPTNQPTSDGKIIHKDRYARLTRQAVGSDPTLRDKAREALGKDPDGQAFLRTLNTSNDVEVSTRARVLSDAERVYGELEYLRENDRGLFGERMADPSWRKFYEDMQGWRPGEVQPTTNNGLGTFYSQLQAQPDAQVLQPEDWDQVDPDMFADLDPDQARIAMARKTDQLIRLRTREARQAPVRQEARELQAQEQRLHQMARSAPPVPAGTASAPRDFDTVRREFHEAYNDGRVSDEQKSEYYAVLSAQRRNQGKRWV